MKNKTVICVLACVLVFFSSASVYARSVKFEPVVEGQSLSLPVDVVKLEKSVRLALVSFDWRLVEEEPGSVTARFEKSGGKIFAIIRIFFSEEGYRIEYVDSKNLDANLEKKTIHGNYVRWIANLDKNIYTLYLK